MDYSCASLDPLDPVVTQYNSPADYAANYYYTPGFSDPHNVLGMGYLTTKLKLTDQWTINAGTAFAIARPTWRNVTVTIRSYPSARLWQQLRQRELRSVARKGFAVRRGNQPQAGEFLLWRRGFLAMIWDYIEPVPAWVDPSTLPGSATRRPGSELPGLSGYL